MKRMALKSKFGFTKINHNYTEEERQVGKYCRQLKKISTFAGSRQLPLARVPPPALKGFQMIKRLKNEFCLKKGLPELAPATAGSSRLGQVTTQQTNRQNILNTVKIVVTTLRLHETGAGHSS